MKYMHSEWQRRLAHWQHTLQMDFYFPLGSIDVESFFTTEHLTPEEAQSRHFEPMSTGTTWGHSYEYCWMHSKVILPLNAAGKDLNTGGETTVFINGKAFGTYRAGWVETPHHFIEDNVLTKCGKPGQSYDILLEAYAGHFFPSSST